MLYSYCKLRQQKICVFELWPWTLYVQLPQKFNSHLVHRSTCDTFKCLTNVSGEIDGRRVDKIIGSERDTCH